MLLKEESVWARLNDRVAIRFTCLCDIKAKKYAVQSVDYFYIEDIYQFDFFKQFIELLIEMSHERDDWFDTLEEAIEGFGSPCSDPNEEE